MKRFLLNTIVFSTMISELAFAQALDLTGAYVHRDVMAKGKGDVVMIASKQLEPNCQTDCVAKITFTAVGASTAPARIINYSILTDGIYRDGYEAGPVAFILKSDRLVRFDKRSISDDKPVKAEEYYIALDANGKKVLRRVFYGGPYAPPTEEPRIWEWIPVSGPHASN